MALVEEFLSKNVHTTGQNDPTAVTNILNVDFEFPWDTGQSGYDGQPLKPEIITIPSGATMHFPKYMAVMFAIEIAKRQVYLDCADKKAWKGFHEMVWLPIAERVVTGGKSVPAGTVQKTQGELLKEQIAAMNVADESDAAPAVVADAEPIVEEASNVEEKKDVDYSDMEYKDIVQIAKSKGIKTFQKSRDELIKELNG